MRRGQVFDVHVVADARAVRRPIIGPEDVEGVALAQRHLQRQGDDVRLRVVVFAAHGHPRAVEHGSAGVEVAQRGVLQPRLAMVPV